MKVFTNTGGGARGPAVAGALWQAAYQKKWNPGSFDYLCGDSFGALIVAMIGAGWSPMEMVDLFVKTDFGALLSPVPWNIRKNLLPVKPCKLDKVAAFIDSLKLKVDPRVIVNAWDAENNVQVNFCTKKPPEARDHDHVETIWVEDAFQDGYGKVLTRSMALPGLEADDPKWMDGGLGEHPPLSWIPTDADLLVINLGFPGLVPHQGRTVPNGLLNRALYAYEVTASTRQRYALDEFPKATVIEPQIYDVDSTAFALNATERSNLMFDASQNTQEQWKLYQPIPVNQ